MDKKSYIDHEILKLLQSWGSVVFPSGIFVIGLLILLDYLVAREHFFLFLIFRIVSIGLFVILFILNKRTLRRNLQLGITIAATAITSSMVELMILTTGGHESTYYVGMILTYVFIIGLLPISLPVTFLLAGIIYSIYLFPIFIFDTVTDLKTFINNNLFLVSLFIIGFIWKYINQKLLINKLELEYDLSEEKEQLKIYSTNLEHLVQERTKELSISEKWYRAIFDFATDGIIVLDRNGTIINVNQKTCEIHGFEKDALIGISIDLLEAEIDKEIIRRRLSKILNGESLIYETENYRKDGSKVLLEVSSNAIDSEGEKYIQSFCRDITEKKRLQEQLMHSTKMESIGVLAGGIAHNFNNILTAILGYAELLIEFSHLDDVSRQRVRNIESSARKAGVMVSKLLSFARREAHEVLPLNLHDVINDSLKIFEGALNKKIGLKIQFAEHTPIIEGDPNQIEQIMMNLIVNAKDAMPDGGHISITTRLIDISEERTNIPSYIQPGRYVILSFSDTGTGISQDIISKIFDPFFTTKEKGKGTGLGLATVYGIVKDHKGYISVHSEPSKGTQFEIYFPLSTKNGQAITKPRPTVIEGNENILIVDDDNDVLNFLSDLLENHGYHVMPVNNALNAIDVFKANLSKIKLVITDVVMPLVEGNDLVRILKNSNPKIKIIAVSGFSDTVIREDGSVDAFVKKPFEQTELLATIRKILDAGKEKLPLY
jgi:two-component system, cell cycle sensor histidine kinase and response regulator CckA